MTYDEIHEKLTTVFRDVFDDDSLVLRRDMTAKDVEGWDSLTHINLIVAIERGFKVKFTSREVTRAANVGEFVDLVGTKLV